MSRWTRPLFLLVVLCLGLPLLDASAASAAGPLLVARIDGTVNPASSDYLQQAIREAEEQGAQALLVELDTPGGLVTSTQDMIQAMLNARVPIIVFVSPQGAWAGSAGTFITIAAHVAAMAPGSTIGAAAPVGIGAPSPTPAPDQEGEKAPSDAAAQKAENLLASFIESIAARRNRNVEWAGKAVRESLAITADEALELRVIDLVADDRDDLLAQLETRQVEISGDPVSLAGIASAPVVDVEWPLLTQILNVLAHPNVAVLLFMAGLIGLYIEFNQPGMIVPGAVGVVCLLLALIAFQVLPFSWVGVILILIGIALFVAEAFVTSYGILFAAGVACLLIGGSSVFDRPDLSDLNVSFWSVLVPAVAGMAAFGAIVIWAVGRTLGRSQVAGVGELLGMAGTATTPLSPAGTVFIRGEYWSARADESIEEGSRVEAVGVDGLTLRVRRAKPLS